MTYVTGDLLIIILYLRSVVSFFLPHQDRDAVDELLKQIEQNEEFFHILLLTNNENDVADYSFKFRISECYNEFII